MENLRQELKLQYGSVSEISDEDLHILRCWICSGCRREPYCKRLERIPYEDLVTNPVVLFYMIKQGKCPDAEYEPYEWDEQQVS